MQVKQLKSSVTAITGRVRGAKLLLGVLLISQAGLAAKHERNHPFVAGDVDESRIARQVRHELLMLPYYGVFDDLAFRVDGSTVTLLGAVTRPTLKSDAERVVKRDRKSTRLNSSH